MPVKEHHLNPLLGYQVGSNSCRDSWPVRNTQGRVPLWPKRLRIWHCHYCGSCYCCDASSVLGTSTCCEYGQEKIKNKKERKKRKIHRTHSINGVIENTFLCGFLLKLLDFF